MSCLSPCTANRVTTFFTYIKLLESALSVHREHESSEYLLSDVILPFQPAIREASINLGSRRGDAVRRCFGLASCFTIVELLVPVDLLVGQILGDPCRAVVFVPNNRM
jgi:hypothetical protein